jgi:hypothetical protein
VIATAAASQGRPAARWLGRDAAPSSVEVSGPDCDAVEQSVAALGPPPVGTLPG